MFLSIPNLLTTEPAFLHISSPGFSFIESFPQVIRRAIATAPPAPSSPEHTLLTAFARPSDFVPALQALFQVGHSSGADAPAGFIASHFWSETANLADALRAI